MKENLKTLETACSQTQICCLEVNGIHFSLSKTSCPPENIFASRAEQQWPQLFAPRDVLSKVFGGCRKSKKNATSGKIEKKSGPRR